MSSSCGSTGFSTSVGTTGEVAGGRLAVTLEAAPTGGDRAGKAMPTDDVDIEAAPAAEDEAATDEAAPATEAAPAAEDEAATDEAAPATDEAAPDVSQITFHSSGIEGSEKPKQPRHSQVHPPNAETCLKTPQR
jgi:hypothetical protein